MRDIVQGVALGLLLVFGILVSAIMMALTLAMHVMVIKSLSMFFTIVFIVAYFYLINEVYNTWAGKTLVHDEEKDDEH
jgi:threonine/homoserine/homoserine lactone efflux protein